MPSIPKSPLYEVTQIQNGSFALNLPASARPGALIPGDVPLEVSDMILEAGHSV